MKTKNQVVKSDQVIFESDELQEMSVNINTNRQFFEFIHTDFVSKKLEEVHSELLNTIDQSSYEDSESGQNKYLVDVEKYYKDKLSSLFGHLKSSNGKTVRIMVKVSFSTFSKNVIHTSFFPKWVPRKARQFVKSKDEAVA